MREGSVICGVGVVSVGFAYPEKTTNFQGSVRWCVGAHRAADRISSTTSFSSGFAPTLYCLGNTDLLALMVERTEGGGEGGGGFRRWRKERRMVVVRKVPVREPRRKEEEGEREADISGREKERKREREGGEKRGEERRVGGKVTGCKTEDEDV